MASADSKPAKELSGHELRARAGGQLTERREECRAELGRRRDNLRDAVIPAWERAARGQDPRSWDLTR
jgi:hypothetical protein